MYSECVAHDMCSKNGNYNDEYFPEFYKYQDTRFIIFPTSSCCISLWITLFILVRLDIKPIVKRYKGF